MNRDRYQTVLLFGAPGAGKGTQGKILAQVPGFFHMSTGEMFRNIDISSEIGKVFRSYMTRGELVPDDVVIKLWSQTIHAYTILRLYKPEQDILVLDGLPRSVPQARMMHKYIDVLKVVHLACDNKEEMIKRLAKRALREGRPDDAKEDVIRRRWDVYEKETFPVLATYPKSTIVDVNAVGSPAVILAKILEALAPLQDRHFQNPLGA
ncbi:MAG: nucleoside monophosphate kinase [Phycisphaeraceae bacterium]|nr:MAG: nucleoside monophosphate kinase [Phycisphaeraceae bacterium]